MDCVFQPAGEMFRCKFCGTKKKQMTRRNCTRSTGLGDTVAKITSALGIRPCGGCGSRQKTLNDWVKYRRPEPPQWISTQELVADSYRLAGMLPAETTAIAGVPRSGMIPAAIIAAHRHLPLYTINQGTLVDVGRGSRLDSPPPLGLVVTVDDTVMTGAQLKRTRKNLSKYANVQHAAVYVEPHARTKPDYSVAIVDAPHLLEWNLFNSTFVAGICTDMDGILCDDPPWGEGVSTKDYETSIYNAIPRYLPRKLPVKAIVTARQEKYRAVTEAWLERHGVLYDDLVMGPWATVQERAEPHAISCWKAEQFERLRPNFFVESDKHQAIEISQISGGWVICPDAQMVY